MILSCLGATSIAAAVGGQGTWETSLRGRNLDGDISTFEAWYDTVLDITWLADARAVQTSGYDADGYLNWDDAVTWIASLNADVYLGHDEWRLPTLSPVNGSEITYEETYDGTTDRAYNISAAGTPYTGTTASELAYLYYNTLGNLAYYDINGNPAQPGYGLSNTGPFRNMEQTGYWTDVEYALNPNGAWKFHFREGYQDPDPKFASNYTAWAVHPGDIGSPPRGDINMDGTVSAADVSLAMKYLLGLNTLTALQIAHGDLYPGTGDGALTLSDVVSILQRLFGNGP